jgi:hypothetical protein
MRGEQVSGRFSINHERESIIFGTAKDIVRTVGNVVDWWVYSATATLIDPIYDVGASGMLGGRRWTGPYKVPVINSDLNQGVTITTSQGFYNTDVLMLVINMDVIDGGGLTDGSSGVFDGFKHLPNNPDAFLRDRIVYKDQVFKPVRIDPRGIMTENYTLFGIECHQVNAEEMINDLQFQAYANYNPFGDRNVHS